MIKCNHNTEIKSYQSLISDSTDSVTLFYHSFLLQQFVFVHKHTSVGSDRNDFFPQVLKREKYWPGPSVCLQGPLFNWCD